MRFQVLYALILFSFFCGMTASGESSIRKSCIQARKLKMVTSSADLRNVVCDLRRDYAAEAPVQALANQLLAVLEKGKDLKAWETDPQIKVSLRSLTRALNEVAESAPIVSDTPLTLALAKHLDRWGDPQARVLKENFVAYIQSVDEVVRMTRTGREVTDCFKQTRGPLLSRTEVLAFPPDLAERGASMAFKIRPDSAQPGKYISTVLFNPAIPVIAALFYYVHEMKHGCNAPHYASREATREPSERQRDEFSQEHAVDELRAYRANVEFFKELSAGAPELVCNEFFTSDLFGTQVISTAEYNATIDEMIQDGTFPKHILAVYASLQAIRPQGIFQLNSEGKAKPELRPEVMQKLEDEGFRIKK